MHDMNIWDKMLYSTPLPALPAPAGPTTGGTKDNLMPSIMGADNDELYVAPMLSERQKARALCIRSRLNPEGSMRNRIGTWAI